MELQSIDILAIIGIYPEWNVKIFLYHISNSRICIGIYPEWNVKISGMKDKSTVSDIGIYPEWNVKWTDCTGKEV